MNKVGMYKGQKWKYVPLCQEFPHLKIKSRWYVLEDGSHFKTLKELEQYLNQQRKHHQKGVNQ